MNDKLDLDNLNEEYTRILNDIALSRKKEYTEFVDKYSRKYGSFYLWWTTPFSSRNTYLDDTFLNICYFFLCRQIICSESEINHIVLSNKALYDTLLANYKQELSSGKVVVEYHKKTVKTTPPIILFLLNLYILVNKFINIKTYLKKTSYHIKDCISLIDTPVLDSSFKNGKYQDRYFNNIQDYVKHDIYFVPELNKDASMGWKQFACYVNNSKSYRFIFKEKFLHLYDFLCLMEYFVYCLFLSTRKYKYADIDVTPLVRNSLLMGCCSVPSLKGILNYKFIKRLRKSKFKVENLISWYEGRSSEIMMQKAFRRYYPKSNCVGYTGYMPSEFDLGQSVSREQIIQKAAPLKMTVPGSMYMQQAKQFCSNAAVIKVPVLMNDYSYREEVTRENIKKRILVVLPFFENIAKNMLHILNEYVKKNKDKFDIYIKNHPTHFDKKVEYYTKERIYFNPIYVEGELIKCLLDVDIAFMSYTSATLEVLSQGKSLINLCPLGKLRYTGLPENFSNDLCYFAYGQQEVFNALDEFSVREKKTIDISELLEPVNEETVNRMWE